MRRFAALLAIGILGSSSRAEAGISVTFAYEDDRYLFPGEREGGLVHLPTKADAVRPIPLVVFLHGTNDKGPLHRWFGGGPYQGVDVDLRTEIEGLINRGEIEPTAIAAPSQTKDAASGSHMWDDFDLEAFVAAADVALFDRARIDRKRVIVVGHSGAGCNAKGGLLGIADATMTNAPLSVVALDTCLDGAVGSKLASFAGRSSVSVYWQAHIWPRDIDGLRKVLEAGGGSFSIEKSVVVGDDPHNAIVLEALPALLRRVLPP